MDLLYHRYASPFSFIDGMILSGRFHEFVQSFIKTTQEEKEEETSWQYFLHKVFDGSYADFKNGMKVDQEHRNMSEQTFKTTYENTMNILQNFNPEKGGEA